MAVFTLIASTILAISGWTLVIAGVEIAVGAFLLQTVVSLGVSALAKKFAGKSDTGDFTSDPFAIQASIRTGGEVPRSFMLGPSLTAGSLVWHTEWGEAGDTPNAYYTQVIAISDLPVSGLSGVFINGARATIINNGLDLGGKGHPLAEYYDGTRNHAWIWFHDGTQTEADDFLVNTVSPNAPRTYSENRIGTGVAYAVVTYLLNQSIFTGLPSAKFVVDGIPLYDISKDTSEGGVGPHRWENPATWGGSGDSNPMVQAYNLARGLTYQGNWFYGLQGLTPARLPSAHWIAQVEKCNVVLSSDVSGNPVYQCAGEVTVDSEMGSAFEAILTACAGRISEVGGVFKGYAGAADPSIASFTDDDIVSTAPQSFTPFFGLSNSVNGATASYPSPDEGYVMRQTPPVFNPDYEAEDGNRRLLTNVSLNFVPWPVQAQRLLIGELRAARRARRHTFTLPARYRRVEPGDTVDFTSARNGYGAKLFRVDGIIDLPNCDLIIDMTEVDPTDHSTFDDAGEYVPVTPSDILPVRPAALGVIGFDAQPATIDDGDGAPRRAAVLMLWNGTLDAISGIEFEVRLVSSGARVGSYSTLNFTNGELIVESGLVAATAYEARARYIPVGHRAVSWTSWLPVTTPNVLIGELDIGSSAVTWTKLGQDVRDNIASAGDASAGALAAQIAQAAAEVAESGAVFAQGLTINAQNIAVDAVGILLPANVAAPIEHWTSAATSAGGFPKPPVNAAYLISGDPDFGEGLETQTVNRAFGPAYPTIFDRSRSYIVTAKVKCTDDGSVAGARVQMGFSTFSGAGMIGHQLNVQTDLDPAMFVADGVQTYVLLIKPDSISDLGDFTAFDAAVNHTSISDLADAITPHVRFNGGGATDGTALLGALEIRDITDVLASNISANASFTSEQAALAYRDAAGSYAGASDASRIAAQAAQGQAEIAQSGAVDAFSDADGARVQAEAARDISVEIELRNYAPGLSNPGFESGANLATGIPAGWDGAAADPAALGNGALACYTAPSLVNGSGPNASLVSFGSIGGASGSWWYISKTFKTLPGQIWNIEYWARLAQSVDAAACASVGSDYVGESDSYVHLIFYGVDGAIKQQVTTFTAGYSYWLANAGVPGTSAFFRHAISGKTAPANAAFVEIRIVAADNSHAGNADKTDYSGYSGLTAVMLDDVLITSQNGSVVEAISEFGASQSSISAGISEVAAALALSDAEDAAAGAVFARDVSAKLLGGGQNPNPIFAFPDNGTSVPTPDEYTAVRGDGSTLDREPTGGKYGACIEFATGSALTASKPYLVQSSDQNPDALNADDVEAVEVTLEIEMIAGTWGAARMTANWFAGSGGTSKSFHVYLADALTSRNGKIQTLTFVCERPSGYVPGDKDDFRIIFYGNVNGNANYTESDYSARIHRMDYAVLSQSASALITQRAITDIEGNAEAALVFRAKAGGVTGAVEVVAWDDAGGVGAGSKIHLSADEIELSGLAVFEDGLQSDDFVSGTTGFRLGTDGLEITNLITGAAIIGGAVTREFVRSVSYGNNVSATAVEIIPQTAVDFLDYNATPFPGNPVLVTASGTFHRDDNAAPYQLGVYVEGKVGAGGAWTAANLPTLYFYFDGAGINHTFCKSAQDVNFGYGLDSFTHIRWMAKLIVNSYYTGTTGSIANDLVIQARQINK